MAGLVAGCVLLAAACGNDSREASVRAAMDEYLRAVSQADADLFCARIEPGLAFFSDEDNCLDVMRYQAAQTGRLSPRFREEPFVEVTTELVALDVETTGERATVQATIRWTGENTSRLVDLDQSTLFVNLTRSNDGWRISSFAPAREKPLDGEREVVAEAVRAYYDALNQTGPGQSLALCESMALAASDMASVPSCRNSIGHAIGPETMATSRHEHRSGSVLARIVDVRIEGAFAMATVVAHTTDNGALSHPVNDVRHLFAREDGHWGVVRNFQHDAWGLFDSN